MNVYAFNELLMAKLFTKGPNVIRQDTLSRSPSNGSGDTHFLTAAEDATMVNAGLSKLPAHIVPGTSNLIHTQQQYVSLARGGFKQLARAFKTARSTLLQNIRQPHRVIQVSQREAGQLVRRPELAVRSVTFRHNIQPSLYPQIFPNRTPQRVWFLNSASPTLKGEDYARKVPPCGSAREQGNAPGEIPPKDVQNDRLCGRGEGGEENSGGGGSLSGGGGTSGGSGGGGDGRESDHSTESESNEDAEEEGEGEGEEEGEGVVGEGEVGEELRQEEEVEGQGEQEEGREEREREEEEDREGEERVNEEERERGPFTESKEALTQRVPDQYQWVISNFKLPGNSFLHDRPLIPPPPPLPPPPPPPPPILPTAAPFPSRQSASVPQLPPSSDPQPEPDHSPSPPSFTNSDSAFVGDAGLIITGFEPIVEATGLVPLATAPASTLPFVSQASQGHNMAVSGDLVQARDGDDPGARSDNERSSTNSSSEGAE